MSAGDGINDPDSSKHVLHELIVECYHYFVTISCCLGTFQTQRNWLRSRLHSFQKVPFILNGVQTQELLRQSLK